MAASLGAVPALAAANLRAAAMTPPGQVVYPVRRAGLADILPRRAGARPSAVTGAPERDLELVRRMLAGELAAKEAVGDRLACIGRMVPVINRQLGSTLDANEVDDVVGDVAKKVISKLADYAGLAALESWVFMFCVGETRNAVRRKRRRLAREGAAADLLERLPAAPLAAAPQEDLSLCLQALPAEDLALVRAKFFDDSSYEDLSRTRADNINTIKSRVHRAIQKLRRCLDLRAKKEES